MRFAHYYEPKETNTAQYDKAIANSRVHMYADYHKNGQVDAASLREGLLHGKDKAKQLFLSLYSPAYRLAKNLRSSPLVREIDRKYGENIVCHGVEETNGGMATLLMIAICGRVYAEPIQFSKFSDGPPNASALCHGPYYIIANTLNRRVQNNPSIDTIEHILVPFEENIAYIKEQLGKLVTLEIISKHAAEIFSMKLITYEAFERRLNFTHRLRKSAQPANVMSGLNVQGSTYTFFENPMRSPIKSPKKGKQTAGLKREELVKQSKRKHPGESEDSPYASPASHAKRNSALFRSPIHSPDNASSISSLGNRDVIPLLLSPT